MKVLLVEENAAAVVSINRAMSRGGLDARVSVVSDEVSLRCALAQGEWDAVIADIRVSAIAGSQALRIVHEDDENLPFILLAGAADAREAVDLMRVGACDCVMKDDLDRIAVALQRGMAEGRLRHERREELRLASALDHINATIHSTLDTEEVLRRVMVSAMEALHADAAALAMRRDDRWVIRNVVRLDIGLVGRSYDTENASGAEAVASRQSALVISREQAEDGHDTLSRDLDGRSVAHVPLIVKGRVAGVMSFVYTEERAPLPREAAAFAERLACTVSLALENARLYEAQQGIAQTLQQSLLALPARVPGVQFAHRYSSATESARVGGDFYDIYELEPGVVALSIGDVSGKGIDAASLTALVKNVMRSHAVAGDTPCEVMAKTNQIVHRFTPPEVFATAFCALIEHDSGVPSFCCVGHPVPMVVRRGGSTEPLTASNNLVGAFPGLFFDEGTAVLGREDYLLMYTDGLIEARTGGEMYGQHRLQALLESRSWPDVDTLADAVLSELRAFTGGRLRDDLALLAVRLD